MSNQPICPIHGPCTCLVCHLEAAGRVKSERKAVTSVANGAKGGRKSPGYRLHWEGQADEAESFATMADVNTEIRKKSLECEITYIQGCSRAYVVTEAEWQSEQEAKFED